MIASMAVHSNRCSVQRSVPVVVFLMVIIAAVGKVVLLILKMIG
jgi:hypothetical protein